MRADHILTRRLTLAVTAIVLTVLVVSCSGLWTSLHNPVDPTNCEVDEKGYWPLLSGDNPYNNILEKLKYSNEYEVLYLGFNDGKIFFGDTNAPFIMVTTKEIHQIYEHDGDLEAFFPILDVMSIYDQFGNPYIPSLHSTTSDIYYADDGKQYTYYIATFSMNGVVDTTQTYNVQINDIVYSRDGMMLTGRYSFTVRDENYLSSQAMDLFGGLSSRLLHNFSEQDENWSWHKRESSGVILTDLGVYAVHSRISGDEGDKVYFKRYPYQIPEGDFAVRAEVGYPETNGDLISGLFVSDAVGAPVAVIMVSRNGWLRCFAPGSSDDEMRRVRECSIPDFNPESAVLGLRREGPMMCYCVNGVVFARENVSGHEITNAGVMVNSVNSVEVQTVYFDNFEIAY